VEHAPSGGFPKDSLKKGGNKKPGFPPNREGENTWEIDKS